MPEDPEGHRTHAKHHLMSWTERPALSPGCHRSALLSHTPTLQQDTGSRDPGRSLRHDCAAHGHVPSRDHAVPYPPVPCPRPLRPGGGSLLCCPTLQRAGPTARHSGARPASELASPPRFKSRPRPSSPPHPWLCFPTGSLPCSGTVSQLRLAIPVGHRLLRG